MRSVDIPLNQYKVLKENIEDEGGSPKDFWNSLARKACDRGMAFGGPVDPDEQAMIAGNF